MKIEQCPRCASTIVDKQLVPNGNVLFGVTQCKTCGYGEQRMLAIKK